MSARERSGRLRNAASAVSDTKRSARFAAPTVAISQPPSPSISSAFGETKGHALNRRHSRLEYPSFEFRMHDGGLSTERNMDSFPILRSLLFVPGSRPEFLPKAEAAKPDAIILDLEDSVPVHAKDQARRVVAKALRERADRLTAV